MVKKALFLIVIFYGCAVLPEPLIDEGIEYLMNDVLIEEGIFQKSKKQKKKLERDKILNLESISEPKRKVGEKWIDSNGQKWRQNKGYKIKVFDQKVQRYTGWWVYGEGQHIFKDEQTLGEWTLTFLNENMEELVKLYLAVCEMEYFPMECIMQGNMQNDTLQVVNFEITYIQGCGE
jgi:hypothetical protein